MKNTAASCIDCRAHAADLLLDEDFLQTHSELAAHLAGCANCAAEFDALRSTMAVLDEWQAPEASAYFDSRLHARLREVQAAEPEGWLERIRSFLLFSTGRQLRPALAGALGVVLLAGGGTGLIGLHQHRAANQASATVNDLRLLDNNVQALQQMDQLLDDGSGEDGGETPAT